MNQPAPVRPDHSSRRRWAWTFGAFGLLFLLVSLWCAVALNRQAAARPAPVTESPEAKAERELLAKQKALIAEERFRSVKATAEKNIAELQKLGVLRRLDCEAHEAWLEPIYWTASSYDAKRGMAQTFVSGCMQKPDDASWVNIVDNRTGKRLGKLGAWGFTVD